MRDQLDRVKRKMQVLPAEGLSETAASSSSWTGEEPSNVMPSVPGKSKKRPLSEQNIVPCKLMKLEKSDLRHGGMANFDDFVIIAKKQEGIKTIPSMDKLFFVMIENRNGSASKLVDIVSHRTMLASIVAATEKEDCLTHFVQLGGLRVLNAWLQEAHKGKIGHGSSKDVQASVEGLLLMLIRALSKLPVDFDALKSCIVGKSVNKLRGHGNLEVQKMARELVDTWKKRVNAQMKSSDEETSILLPSTAALVAQSTKVHSAQSAAFAKSVANGAVTSGESRIIEQTRGGHREHSTISSPKQSSGEPVMRATNGTSVVDKKEKDVLLPVKKEKGLLSVAKKDTDCPLAVKEERSCSSSYSQNNSQSCSSGFMKGNGRRQEETKPMAPVGPKLSVKVCGHNKSQLAVLSPHKDSMAKHKGEKILLQKASDGAHVERNNPRLIVRLPNPGRASSHPVREVPAIDGKAVSDGGSSPSPSRQDHGSESIRANSGQSPQMTRNQRLENVSLEVKIDRSCLQVCEANSCKSVVLQHKSKFCNGNSVQPIVQKKRTMSSEKSPSPLAFDAAHGGIDLLASVAAFEVIEEENFGRSNDGEQCFLSTDALKSSFMQDQINSSHQHGEKKKVEQETCVKVTPFIIQENGLSDSLMTSPCRSVEDKGSEDLALTSEERVSCRYRRKTGTSATVTTAEVVVHDKKRGSANSVARGEDDSELMGNSTGNLLMGKIQTASKSCNKGCNDDGVKEACMLSHTNTKTVDSFRSYGEDALEAGRQGAKEVEQEVEDSKPEVQDEISGNLKESPICEDFPIGSNKITSGNLVDAHIDAATVRTDAGMLPENVQVMIKPTCLAGMYPKVDERCLRDTDEEPLQLRVDSANDSVPVLKHVSVSAIAEKEEAASAVVEVNSSLKKMHPSDGICGSKAVERAVFDLNEEFNADDLESIPAHPIPVSQIQGVPCLDSSSHVAPQTTPLTMPVSVVAATKGSFVPPSNPSWAKGDLGWKGSAATSAFRPAEPRRVTESTVISCKAIASPCASSVATSEYRRQPRMLNIDLNVADERVLDDSSMIAMLPSASCSQTLIDQALVASRELDLNRTDENDENPFIITSRDRTTLRARLNVPAPTASRVILDIDLNDGLCNGEESVSQHRVPESSQDFFTGTRHNVDIANVSSWDLVACSTATAMVMPTLPTSNRSEPSYSVVSPPSSKGHMTRGNILGRSFSNDPYQQVMAFSSCGVPYSGSYAGFPFGSSFPETHTSYNIVSPLCSSSTSALLTGVPSEMVSTGAVISPYGGSYLMGNVGGDIPGLASSASWITPSLDLNTGSDICSEGGRQSIGASQYRQLISASGNFKRKAPEGSLDSFRPGFKQTTWR